MRGERKSDSTEAGRGNTSLSFYMPARAEDTHTHSHIYRIHRDALEHSLKNLLGHTHAFVFKKINLQSPS